MKTEHTIYRFVQRPAFTLVELLVVIAIIAMLAGIIIPAVNAAREAARRAQCLDRMRQIGIALHTYEKANNGLPGYSNQLTLSGTPISFSWATAILAELGETKRYNELIANPSGPGADMLPVFLCPSAQKTDPGGNQPPLSFVVNCGPAPPTGVTDVVKFSLFVNRAVTSPPSKKKLEDIKDGTSNTILLTENLQALTWYTLTTSIEQFGFQWHNGDVDTAAVYSIVRINFDRSGLLSIGTPAVYTRPSSNHPGLVNMLYADGVVNVMNDNVDFNIYFSGVCPDDTAAQMAKADGGLGYILPLAWPAWPPPSNP